MPVVLEDISEAWASLYEWCTAGGESEDRYDELLRHVEKMIRGFCVLGGRIEMGQVDFVNANSDLELAVQGGQFVLPVPKLGGDGELAPHSFYPE